VKEMVKSYGKTKIRALYIIGYQENKMVIYKNAEMIFENGEIQYLGKKTENVCEHIVDYKNAIISPGFIDMNALGDIDHAQMDTEIDLPEKLLWSEKYVRGKRCEVMSQEEEAFKSLYAYAQLLIRGITTAMPITSVYYKKAGETTEEIEAAVEHGKKLGMRLYLGPSYLAGMHVYDRKKKRKRIVWLDEEGTQGLDRAMQFVKNHRNEERMHPIMVPERIELQTEEILLRTKAFARNENILMRLHAAQSDFEYDAIYDKYKLSPIQYLDKLELLDEKTIIPHALFTSGFSKIKDTSKKDLEILAKRKVPIVHCPLVYPRFSAALESFGRFQREGIPICMGTDTFPPDMLEAIRLGHAMAMIKDEGRKENRFAKFFEASTIGGARALGREDIGRLCKGAKADFFVVNLEDFDLGVFDDPIKTLCLNVRSHNIADVYIHGKLVVKDQCILNFTYDNMQEKANKYYRKMKDSFIQRSAFEEANFFPSTYETISFE
jgi:cytosine/adenosine deaminase-related metal-dependent hydrolase